MTQYAQREDVLRELGGEPSVLKQRIEKRRWDDEPLTTVTVDGLEFEVPTSVLVRIDKRIEQASSRLNTAILAAYEREPFEPYPDHLVQATAQLAAFGVPTVDGQLPDYLKRMKEDVDRYFGMIADKLLDLGIPDAPRPYHRAPAATVVKLGGGL